MATVWAPAQEAVERVAASDVKYTTRVWLVIHRPSTTSNDVLLAKGLSGAAIRTRLGTLLLKTTG
jgi:hypothetical protein